VLEVGGLSDDARASLSAEAQASYAHAVEAINKGDVIPSPMVPHHHNAEDDLDGIAEDGADNNDRSEPPTDRPNDKDNVPDLVLGN